MPSWSLDELSGSRPSIENLGWTVVSWGADHHDSAIFAFHRPAEGGEGIFLTVLLTPADNPTAHYADVVAGKDHGTATVLSQQVHAAALSAAGIQTILLDCLREYTRASGPAADPVRSRTDSHGSLDLVDVSGLRDAVLRALENDAAAATGYGPSNGYLPLRTWIAERYHVSPEQVLVANSSLQAFAFLLASVVGEGEEVVVERPTYDRVLHRLVATGAKIHPISMDGDGLDTDQLRELLQSSARPRLLYTTPTFQNPTGITLSLDRRRDLLYMARDYGFLVVEDDSYADTRFRGDALPSLLSLDDPARPTVAVVSSFDRTICPGLGVAYMIGSAQLLATVTQQALRAYVSPTMLAEVTAYEYCTSGGLDRSTVQIRRGLEERLSALVSALRRDIPDAAFLEPDGGYFIWIELPPDVDTERLLPAAESRGVRLARGTDFLLDGGEHAIRLAYHDIPAQRIDQRVRALAAAIQDVREPIVQGM